MITKLPFPKKVQIPEVQILSFDALRACQHSNPAKPEDHHVVQFYHLIFVTKGKNGIHYIDFKPHQYTERNVIISSKGQAQSLKTLPFHDGILLTFTEKYLTSLNTTNPYISFQLNNIVFSNPVVTIPKEEFNKLILLLELAIQDTAVCSAEKVEVIKSYVKIILLKVLAIHKKENFKSIQSMDITSFIQFQQLLSDNQYKKKEVKFYADLMHISPQKLSLISKKTIGKSAKEYIISIILLEAKRLLKYSHLSVKEVGFILGFEEATNFSKFFKKHADLLPSEFIASN